MAPPLRHHGSGQRHLLAGRRRRPPLVAARRRGRRPCDLHRRIPRNHRRVLGRNRRRRRELPDQRVPHDPADPAARRRLRLSEEPRDGDDDRRPCGRAVGVRGPNLARAGLVAEEPGLHPGGEGVGRVDAANRVRRAGAEHDQPDRGGVCARLLHRAPHRRGSRVPRPRRPVEDELGRHALLGADELHRAPGRVVAVLLGIDEFSNPRLRAERTRRRRLLATLFGGRLVARAEASS